LISYFKSGEFSRVTGSVGLEDYLEHVKEGRWQDKVLAVRNGRLDKKNVPSVTVSGQFDGRRRRENFTSHSGVIGIDLDDQDNPGLLDKRERLQQDPHCYACHTSIRGFGLVWYVKVSPAKHLEAFQAIEKYLANEYGVVVDPSGKDVSRLRYISYDPHLYLNKASKKWSKYLTKKEREPQAAPRINAYHNEDIAHILQQITSRGVNIAEDYHSWLHISFALASEFGESGREYFHAVSAQSSKYESARCDAQYDIALKRDHSGGVSIGTFFYYCKQAGIETTTPTTREAVAIYRQRVKMDPGKSRKEAAASVIEYMEKIHGVGEERLAPVLEQMEEVPDRELREQRVNDRMTEIETFIRSLGLRYNEITRKVEQDGVPLDERDINTIYRKALHAIDDKLSKNRLLDLIDSDLIESYNPFLEFIKKNKHLKPSGVVQELLDCFEYEKPDLDMMEITQDEAEADYLEVFLTRWLVGIISAMHGTYSLLVLVLTGGQGTGKSRFFRDLWPPELKPYYAESKLDEGKDGGILMCQKLCIMDDEFSGKSKTEAKKFKEISSRDTFTVRRPYGKVFEDLPRYAVLCGTSNDEQIINDPTGNRRLIPVNVTKIDLERFAAIDKTELFMELYWMWREIGDAWMLTKKEIAYLNKSTTKNEQISFEAEMILKYFEPAYSEGGNTTLLSASEIKQKLDFRTGERVYVNKLGAVLKSLGFEQVKKKVAGQVVRKYLVVDYYKPNSEGIL